jgi:hypothetical protein
MSLAERRKTPRTRVDLLFNKYIDGYPHLCRTIDVSAEGILLERVSEPALDREFYPLEIGVVDGGDGPIERIWIWAQQVWTDGTRQALRFVGMEARDRAKLGRLLSRAGLAVA